MTLASATPSWGSVRRMAFMNRRAPAAALASISLFIVKAGWKATSNMRTARPIRNSICAASVLVVTACAAPMGAQECSSADWYRLGYRDGDVYGLQAQIDQYAE